MKYYMQTLEEGVECKFNLVLVAVHTIFIVGHVLTFHIGNPIILPSYRPCCLVWVLYNNYRYPVSSLGLVSIGLWLLVVLAILCLVTKPYPNAAQMIITAKTG